MPRVRFPCPGIQVIRVAALQGSGPAIPTGFAHSLKLKKLGRTGARWAGCPSRPARGREGSIALCNLRACLLCAAACVRACVRACLPES